jgi:hypothetical protein
MLLLAIRPRPAWPTSSLDRDLVCCRREGTADVRPLNVALCLSEHRNVLFSELRSLMHLTHKQSMGLFFAHKLGWQQQINQRHKVKWSCSLRNSVQVLLV